MPIPLKNSCKSTCASRIKISDLGMLFINIQAAAILVDENLSIVNIFKN